MRFSLLDPAVMTAYADLHQACLEPAFDGRGISFTTKTRNGRVYWYTNIKIGRTPRQKYLGPDSPDIRELMEKEKAFWQTKKTNRTTRARLVNMVLTGGMPPLHLQEGKILRLLERTGVFLAGGVLVGTPAFRLIGNALGVLWGESHTTRDVDLAFDFRLPIAIQKDAKNLEDVILESEMGFVPIPALNRKAPSTQYKIRNDDYSIELLTPEIGRPASRPVKIASWGVMAQPLRYLDYLIEDTEVVTAPFDIGLLCVVPSPARFALHKLVVSQQRPTVATTKAQKDVQQAAALLDVLLGSNPGAVVQAFDAAKDFGPKFLKHLQSGIRLLPDDLQLRIQEWLD